MCLRKAWLLMVVGTVLPTGSCVARAQQTAKPTLQFEVASVRENQEKSRRSVNVPLDTEDAFEPTGGLYEAKGFPLINYIAFAYKQLDTPALRSQLPKWALTTAFDIEARGARNPTKEQYREMMRSLLAERFKLQAHTETRQIKIFAMVLAKPGKPGPQLRAHSDGAACSGSPTITPMGMITSSPPQGADLAKPVTLVGVFPSFCGGVVGGVPVDPEKSPGLFMAGGRGMSMALIADFFSQRGPRNNLGDRPILDRTGLAGDYDFIVEWASPAISTTPADTVGATMQDALKEQLGVKLEPTEGPVEVLLIDHIEQPTAN